MSSQETIERFVERWAKEQDFYHRAAALCHDQCRTALEQNGIRHISTFRSKRADRLAAKLAQRLPERERDGRAYTSDEDIIDDIVDLAGVRIALYFPADIKDTLKVLTDHLEIVQRKTFPDPSFERHGAGIYPYRFSGYAATHLRVKLKESALVGNDRRYAAARIEIQVASLFMHAWSEVEHDLVYKPLRGELSVGEYSLLDQVNGLAYAGEVALEQLQRVMLARIADDERPFQNHYDLASFIHKTLASANNQNPRMGRADKLLSFLRRLKLDRPLFLEQFVKDLGTTTDARPLVERLADRIIAAGEGESEGRRRLWNEVLAASEGPSPYAVETAVDEVAESLLIERRLRKRHTTFERVARGVLDRVGGGGAARLWTDRAVMERDLGFDERTAKALLAAHQTHVRALADQGIPDQLGPHADLLEEAIRELYMRYPDLADDGGESR